MPSSHPYMRTTVALYGRLQVLNDFPHSLGRFTFQEAAGPGAVCAKEIPQ